MSCQGTSVILPGNRCRFSAKRLDDVWPESVEEQGLLLLIMETPYYKTNILKMCYRQSRRGVSRQYSTSTRQ